jgi:hypothetical protein
MGTNLSQVFVSTNATLLTGAAFSPASALSKVGVWDQSAATPGFTVGALYDAAGVWAVNKLQFVQGTATNPIATPLIDTRNIKRISFDPYSASVRAKQVTGTLVASTEYNVKLIIRTTPTTHLNFTNDNPGLVDLSGGGYDFPLGGYNTTNHKALNIGIASSADAATACDSLVANIAASPILNEMFTTTDNSSTVDVVARHAGVQFEMIVTEVSTAATNGDVLANGTAVAFVPGVGNDWQVLGEEIRCRSRQGNFNRMYLPQGVTTYTASNVVYHKITIEYAHNWPTSTGIAPAGELNQVVLYVSQNSETILDAADNELDTMFVIGSITDDVLDPAEFVW